MRPRALSPFREDPSLQSALRFLECNRAPLRGPGCGGCESQPAAARRGHERRQRAPCVRCPGASCLHPLCIRFLSALHPLCVRSVSALHPLCVPLSRRGLPASAPCPLTLHPASALYPLRVRPSSLHTLRVRPLPYPPYTRTVSAVHSHAFALRPRCTCAAYHWPLHTENIPRLDGRATLAAFTSTLTYNAGAKGGVPAPSVFRIRAFRSSFVFAPSGVRSAPREPKKKQKKLNTKT